RHKDRRSNFVSRTRQEFNLEVVEAASIREAVQGAQIITTATRATEPFLTADMISRGAHINSIGAIVATRAEVAEDVLARCDQVVVDSQPQARKLSRELMEYFGSGEGHWEQVASLANVVADRKERSARSDLTLFKSLGMGISDLSLGMELYRKALEQGVGRPWPQPEKAVPRLQTTT
ncbi:MAG: ornithine cyclodeaminase family protein, partial [Acidobacteria bacterium]|nr:ornithine cyclodeaminase family protein [Acidobacteriota bacterium]